MTWNRQKSIGWAVKAAHSKAHWVFLTKGTKGIKFHLFKKKYVAMFWLLESWRWNCSPSRATRVWEITEKELYTSEYFNLKIKCTGTFKLTFVPMNGAWFSLKWRAHASTKKGNAENGRSILLTIPTKRCLASYSSSAEAVKNSRHVRVSGFQSPWNFSLWIPESEKIFFVKSGILGVGIWNIQLKESRIH